MRHYLDHAATTPALPQVVAAVAEQMAVAGNASSLHASGRAARKVVEEAREIVGSALGAGPSEVIFTSGGTESDNLAVKGLFYQRRADDARRTRLVVSAIEHHAVLDCVDFLVEHEAAQVTWVRPDALGRIDPASVREAIAQDPTDVALVSVMWANNEVGAVQPVEQITAIAHEFEVPVHTDAVQAMSTLPIDFAGVGADLLTASGHKIGGPMGVGILLARRDIRLRALTQGGGQERGLRSGTLDAAAIRGFAVAAAAVTTDMSAEQDRLASLRDKMIRGALDAGFDITVSGPHDVGDVAHRLPGNVHLLVPDCDGDSLLYLLDAAGIECSTGSACQAGVPRPSHVLLAMGVPEKQAGGALRLSLGHTSQDGDVAAFLDALPAAIERAQRAHHAGRAGERRR